MSVVLNFLVEDVNDKMLTYSSIQLERSTLADGSYLLIATIPLVHDVYSYEYEDQSGTINNWYHFRYYNPIGPQVSQYSNPFRPPGNTRKLVRQRMMQNHRAGFVFVAGTGSTTTKVYTNDYRFKISTLPPGRGKNAFLKQSGGTNAGETRVIINSSPVEGWFEVNPALSGVPASGDEFEWHWLMEPGELDRAINRGLQRYWYIERVPIIGSGQNAPFSLAYLPWLTQKKQICGLWWTPDEGVTEQPWEGHGRWWNITQDQGHLNLLIPWTQLGKVMTLECLRTADPVETDISSVPAHLDLDLVAAFTYDEILTWMLEGGHSVTNIDRKGWAAVQTHFRSDTLQTLIERNRPDPRYALPMTRVPSTVRQPYVAR